MKAKQISVFLENKWGRLAEATKILGESGINIRALSVADTADYGVLRMIVNEPDRAHDVLKSKGFTVTETDVIAIEVSDEPGGLARVLEVLKVGNINVEYIYCFLEKKSESAILILRVEDAEKAAKFLKEAAVSLIKPEDLYNM
ncbi:MAG: ACT domain-containing protein [Actinomycetota bacterium]|nr:ACT domain-containing protein [Actinomycetota bacterium]